MGEGTRLTLLMVGVVVPGRREEADYSGKDLLTTKKLMDVVQRSMVRRESRLLELPACCCSWLVQNCLLKDDLLGGDRRGVVEISTAPIRKKRLLLEEHRGSWWRRLVFLVRRKGGVMYGWDEGTPLLLLPACTLMVAKELRLLVMVAYWCRRLRRRNSTAGALAKPKFLGSGSPNDNRSNNIYNIIKLVWPKFL